MLMYCFLPQHYDLLHEYSSISILVYCNEQTTRTRYEYTRYMRVHNIHNQCQSASATLYTLTCSSATCVLYVPVLDLYILFYIFVCDSAPLYTQRYCTSTSLVRQCQAIVYININMRFARLCSYVRISYQSRLDQYYCVPYPNPGFII